MSPSTKTQIVFPEDLLAEVDQLVGGRKRSDFVVAATREKVTRIRFQKVLQRAAGSWSAKDHPETRSQKTVTGWLKGVRKKTQKRLQGSGRE